MWWVVGLVACFAIGAFLGAPYLPILKRDREALLDLAQLKAGQTLVDLGSGDGRLLRAAAKRGARAIGYEINPILFVISWLWCWPYRRLVTVRLGDFWSMSLPTADVISVFLIERYMSRLETKLVREIHAPTLVVSYIFKLPRNTPIRATKNSYCYQLGN